MRSLALTAVAALALASAVRADDGLAPAFAAARKSAAESRASLPFFRADAAAPLLRAQGAFVPDACTVKSWCLVKATDCFAARVDHPAGLFQGVAQYSVVRRAVALCPYGPYGRWEEHAFMGPVEPQVFRSEVETDEATAAAAALKLCQTYRKDWVDAAPLCGN